MGGWSVPPTPPSPPARRRDASDDAEEEEDVKEARFAGENDGPTKALAPLLINARMIMDAPAENLILAMLAQE